MIWCNYQQIWFSLQQKAHCILFSIYEITIMTWTKLHDFGNLNVTILNQVQLQQLH